VDLFVTLSFLNADQLLWHTTGSSGDCGIGANFDSSFILNRR
jgi:hypothetical protein